MSVAVQGASVAPEVRIVAPASPLATQQRFVDITVHFRATKGNCKYIDLLLDGQVVASYENPPSIKEGDHTFPNVDLGTVLNRGATLAVIGYQGSRNNPNGASDPNAPGAAIAVQYDTVPPVISNLAPADASLLGAARPMIGANFADALSGVLVSSVALSVDDVNVTGQSAVSATGVVYTPAAALNDGAHAVVLTVRDAAGNQARAEWGFAVDTQPPVITIGGIADGAFTNQDVTPNVNVVDAHPGTSAVTLNGAPFTPGAAIAAEGAYTLAVTATDLAGNTAATSLSFTIDKTPPQIAVAGVTEGLLTNQDVTPVITVTDPHLAETAILLDGQPFVSGTAVSAEAAHTLAVTARDAAGNVANAALAFTIDKTPPVLTATQDPPANEHGWNNGPVTVDFAATDTLSGVAQVSGPVTLGAEGAAQQVAGSATDRAGNTTTASVTVNVDLTAPTLTSALAPAPNAAGWNNADVTVAFAAADTLSGVATVSPETVVTAEGASQAVQGTATDRAGNIATTTATVNLDKTPPQVTATAAPAANANGWNNSDVTVTFAAADALSGIAAVTGPATVTTEGTAQEVAGSATDLAGNAATVTASVNVDKTSPVISNLTPADHSEVQDLRPVIGADFADVLSGVVPASVALVLDGVDVTGQAAVSATGVAYTPAADLALGMHTVRLTVRDVAGNAAVAEWDFTIAPLIPPDPDPPVIAITGVADVAAYNHAVTPVVTVTDAHLAETAILLDGQAFVSGTPVSAEGVHTLAVTARDEAGNVANASLTFTIDMTPPAITATAAPAPNAAGWNNADVTVTFTAADALSGVATVTAPVTVTAEGAAQAVAGSATDRAGNTATASVTVSLDQTAPAISNLAPPDGGEVEGLTPTISAEFADGLAGIDLTSVVLTVDGVDVTAHATVAASVLSFSSVPPMAPGDHTVSLTVLDLAGNETYATWAFSITEPLAIASIDPGHGTTEGGTWVDVYGSGFTPESDVRFGGTPADEVKFYSSSKLVAVAPAHGAGVVDVTVTNPDATAVTLDAAFEYLERLTFNIDVAGGPNATRSDVQEYDVLYGNTVPLISGTFAGGKPPYQLEVTYYSDQGTTVVIPVDGNAFSADIDLLEGFHYVFVLGADSTGDVTWTAFYYVKDTTGPAAPGSIHAYPTPGGTGATVLWPPSPSMDAVKYELNIRSWSDATGEGGVISTQTVQLGDVPFGKADVSGLTTGERYTARVTPIDRSGNRGGESDRCIFQALKFFDLHDTKKTVQEKRLALDTAAPWQRVLGWSGAFSTLEELSELQSRVAWFSYRSVEDRSDLGPQLAYIFDIDPFSQDGGWYCIDTSWPAVGPVPDTAWIATPGWVTAAAVSQVCAEQERVTEWTPAQSGDWVRTKAESLCYDAYSSMNVTSAGWDDCWNRFMATLSGPHEPPFWVPAGGAFGLNAMAFYDTTSNPPRWAISGRFDSIVNMQCHIEVQFAAPQGVSRFFWTDHGSVAPGALAIRDYPFGDFVKWADPATGSTGQSLGNDHYGMPRYYVYRESARTLEQVAVVITPDAEYVNAGAAVGVDAFVIYKCAGWDGAALNGVYDLGEAFDDSNDNGVRDADEDFTDEDAVFCYIPTPIECTDPATFVCNQGGSIFVGFDPGTYTLTTPQGGSGKINVLGVNVKFTDTASNTLNWQDEDLYGGLTPVNDALNPDMSTVKLSAILPPDLTGTFTIRTGPDIELWKGGALFLAANAAATGLSESQVTAGNFDVKGISVTAESHIALEFWPDGASVAQYADSVKVYTVGMALGDLLAWSTGSLRVMTLHKKPDVLEWIGCVPANFDAANDQLVFDAQALFGSLNPGMAVRVTSVTASGAIGEGALKPYTPDPAGQTKKEPTVQSNLKQDNSRVFYVQAAGPGVYDITISGEPEGVKDTGQTVTKSPMQVEAKVTVFQVRIKRNGQQLTLTPTDASVGEKISLVGEVEPPGLPVSGSSWSIPGNRLKDYRIENDGTPQTHTVKETLEPSDLQNQNTVAFHWVEGGDLTVSYSVELFGQSYQAQARFNVLAPSAHSLKADLKNAVTVRQVGETWWLYFGPDMGSIRFTGSGSPPSGFTGTFEIWNVTKATEAYRWNRALDWWQRRDDEDTRFDWRAASPNDDNPGDQIQAPGWPWGHWYRMDKFRTWLMFKPSTSGARWVPVRALDWRWFGDALRSVGLPDTWQKLQGNRGSPDPGSTIPSIPMAVIPEWNLDIDAISNNWQILFIPPVSPPETPLPAPW